jgi:two-component system, NtrC family, response regulator HydG
LKPNIRLICATNVNVEQALKEGKLREDLYFRVNTLMLPVPPLRERQTDIPLLADHFLRNFASQHGKTVSSFDADATRVLVDYSWPGNVRELQHVVERAVILTEGDIIEVEDLPENVSAPSLKS